MDEQKQKQKQKQNYSLTQEFVEKLVEAVVGQKFSEISPDKQIEIEKEILPLYIQFTVNHVLENHGEKDSSRVKALLVYGDETILTKFPHINDHLGEALDSFLGELDKNKNK